MSGLFQGKARTLLSLQENLMSASVLPIHLLRFTTWIHSGEKFLQELLSKHPGENFAVRSSSANEDLLETSNAGKFLTRLDVRPHELPDAIRAVFESLPDRIQEKEIFVQPMLVGANHSGVAFTHDPRSGSPYFIIEWSDGSRTDVVTSGSEPVNKLTVADDSKAALEPWQRGVIKLLKELKKHFPDCPLDVEFAVKHSKTSSRIWLFQVRPLLLSRVAVDQTSLFAKLYEVERHIELFSNPAPGVLGKKTFFGVMPDWNPAEIIGTHPKPLALSTYREIVTDAIWAYQRSNYGYRSLRSVPLLVDFFGLPYVDLRASFNSFVPASLDSRLAAKLVDFYLDKFEAGKQLHDKIEFEIVLSCFDFDSRNRFDELAESGFTDAEICQLEKALKELTFSILSPRKSLFLEDLKKISELVRRRSLYKETDSTLDRIYWLIEDVKRFGTLPFAGIARAAFIGTQLLNSMVNQGLMDTQERESFLASLETVSSEFAHDAIELTNEEMLQKYGHLRPGTYDITIERYDSNPEQYLFAAGESPRAARVKGENFLSRKSHKAIEIRLDELGFELSVEQLFQFISQAVTQRELSKFTFSWNVSEAFEALVALAGEFGFSRDDASFLNLRNVLSLYRSCGSIREEITASIEEGKRLYSEGQLLRLPAVISESNDVWSFPSDTVTPNFVTSRQVRGAVAVLDGETSLESKIVLIESADPGYDWVFSRNISGIVTAWGGANSHMAVRAGELGIPAVIGCGLDRFRKLANSRELLIDCAAETILVVE